jgi:hypothetical protein
MFPCERMGGYIQSQAEVLFKAVASDTLAFLFYY